MTTRAQNDFLSQTGPGTPMGDLFRRYWIPALLAEELPEPDCPPVRVKLLSERLIAFRDTQGSFGLIDEFCAHRGVSLWFGRNEENGLRCAYHGWKYDVTGQCVDVPSEPAESGFCKKIKLKAYPCVERGGVIWTYMGPPELQPPLPEFEWATVPAFAPVRFQALPGMQLPAGDGRRHRLQPRLVPAQRDSATRCTRHQGRQVPAQTDAAVRGDRDPTAACCSARAASRGGPVLLARHPVDHALVHHDPALWDNALNAPRLGADRRRALLDRGASPTTRRGRCPSRSST